MGLDNEFVLRTKKEFDIPEYISITKEEDDLYTFGYQRKNWSYGGAVLRALDKKSDINECTFRVERNDIPKVIENIYAVILNPEDFDSQVFDFSDCLKPMIQAIVDLNWLYNNWDSDDNISLEFVHSF